MKDLERVYAYLKTLSDFLPEDLSPLAGHYRTENFPTGTVVFREGETYQKVNFILKGLMKKTYVTHDGKEFIKEFVWEGQITTPYASLLRGLPASYSMETLEDTEVLTIDYAQVEKMMRENPRWLGIGKALSDTHFLNREDREMELLKYSAAERFAIFQRRFPHLMDRLKKKDVASYLGITPVSLSRLGQRAFAAILFAATTLIASFVASPTASASSVCDYYKKNSPHMYKLVCNTGKSSTKPAGASSTFSSAFNLTSASLPTEPSSYGLEIIGSSLNEPGQGKNVTFALVRGFSKFGTGISTGSNNTFYGDDVLQREFGTWELLSFDEIETARSSMPNLNLGTSFRLLRFSPSVSMKIGTSIRHNKITASWGGGPAVALTSPYLTVGAAVTREKISNFLPPILFSTYQVSARFSIFELEYNQLRNNSAFNQSPVHIYTLTTTIRKLTLTLAQRELDYRNPAGERVRIGQSHFAAQYLFTKHFSAGFLLNYIPGATSIGAQFYL